MNRPVDIDTVLCGSKTIVSFSPENHSSFHYCPYDESVSSFARRRRVFQDCQSRHVANSTQSSTTADWWLPAALAFLSEYEYHLGLFNYCCVVTLINGHNLWTRALCQTRTTIPFLSRKLTLYFSGLCTTLKFGSRAFSV